MIRWLVEGALSNIADMNSTHTTWAKRAVATLLKRLARLIALKIEL